MPRFAAAAAISSMDSFPSLQVECICRSALISFFWINFGKLVRLGRLDLAAVFAQLRRDPGQAQAFYTLPLPSRKRFHSHRRCSQTNDRITINPFASAISRKRMLCSFEPVAYTSAVPNSSGGCTHNCTRKPSLNSMLALVGPFPSTRWNPRQFDKHIHHGRRNPSRRPGYPGRRPCHASFAGFQPAAHRRRPSPF